MSRLRDEQLTLLLNRASAGDHGAREEVLPLLEQRLRGRAEAMLARRPADPLIQPTILLDQTLVDLVLGEPRSWLSRRDFDLLAAKVMHDVLVDHARAEFSQKRGGGHLRIPVEGVDPAATEQPGTCVLVVREVLEELRQVDSGLYELVCLRTYLGKSNAELSECLGVSESTIDRRWKMARTWLRTRLAEEGETDEGPTPGGERGR